jgi:hypothetical protein
MPLLLGPMVGAVLFGLAHLLVQLPEATAVGYTAFVLVNLMPYHVWNYTTAQDWATDHVTLPSLRASNAALWNTTLNGTFSDDVTQMVIATLNGTISDAADQAIHSTEMIVNTPILTDLSDVYAQVAAAITPKTTYVCDQVDGAEVCTPKPLRTAIRDSITKKMTSAAFSIIFILTSPKPETGETTSSSDISITPESSNEVSANFRASTTFDASDEPLSAEPASITADPSPEPTKISTTKSLVHEYFESQTANDYVPSVTVPEALGAQAAPSDDNLDSVLSDTSATSATKVIIKGASDVPIVSTVVAESSTIVAGPTSAPLEPSVVGQTRHSHTSLPSMNVTATKMAIRSLPGQVIALAQEYEHKIAFVGTVTLFLIWPLWQYSQYGFLPGIGPLANPLPMMWNIFTGGQFCTILRRGIYGFASFLRQIFYPPGAGWSHIANIIIAFAALVLAIGHYFDFPVKIYLSTVGNLLATSYAAVSSIDREAIVNIYFSSLSAAKAYTRATWPFLTKYAATYNMPPNIHEILAHPGSTFDYWWNFAIRCFGLIIGWPIWSSVVALLLFMWSGASGIWQQLDIASVLQSILGFGNRFAGVFLYRIIAMWQRLRIASQSLHDFDIPLQCMPDFGMGIFQSIKARWQQTGIAPALQSVQDFDIRNVEPVIARLKIDTASALQSVQGLGMRIFQDYIAPIFQVFVFEGCYKHWCPLEPRWLWHAPIIIMFTAIATLLSRNAMRSRAGRAKRYLFFVPALIVIRSALIGLQRVTGMNCKQDVIVIAITMIILLLWSKFTRFAFSVLANLDDRWDGFCRRILHLYVRGSEAIVHFIVFLYHLLPATRERHTPSLAAARNDNRGGFPRGIHRVWVRASGALVYFTIYLYNLLPAREERPTWPPAGDGPSPQSLPVLARPSSPSGDPEHGVGAFPSTPPRADAPEAGGDNAPTAPAGPISQPPSTPLEEEQPLPQTIISSNEENYSKRKDALTSTPYSIARFNPHIARLVVKDPVVSKPHSRIPPPVIVDSKPSTLEVFSPISLSLIENAVKTYDAKSTAKEAQRSEAEKERQKTYDAELEKKKRREQDNMQSPQLALEIEKLKAEGEAARAQRIVGLEVEKEVETVAVLAPAPAIFAPPITIPASPASPPAPPVATSRLQFRYTKPPVAAPAPSVSASAPPVADPGLQFRHQTPPVVAPAPPSSTPIYHFGYKYPSVKDDGSSDVVSPSAWRLAPTSHPSTQAPSTQVPAINIIEVTPPRGPSKRYPLGGAGGQKGYLEVPNVGDPAPKKAEKPEANNDEKSDVPAETKPHESEKVNDTMATGLEEVVPEKLKKAAKIKDDVSANPTDAATPRTPLPVKANQAAKKDWMDDAKFDLSHIISRTRPLTGPNSAMEFRDRMLGGPSVLTLKRKDDEAARRGGGNGGGGSGGDGDEPSDPPLSGPSRGATAPTGDDGKTGEGWRCTT